jgi:hypothetical protein
MRHGLGDIDIETCTWRHGDMETWRHATQRHGDMRHRDIETCDTETWRLADLETDMETRRHRRGHGDVDKETRT